MRLLARLVLGLAALATFWASSWALWQSPFAAPYRDRTEAEIKVAYEAAMTRHLDMRTVDDRIHAALEAGEVDEAVALVRLADGRGVAIFDRTRTEVMIAEEGATGWSACLACAIDPDACPDLTRLASCNLPLELTPIGDGKAIYRALEAYVVGAEVDRIDLALGVIGLVATVAIVASGGSSASVKAGATALRVARKAGAMTGRLTDEIAGLAMDTLRMDRAGEVLRGSARLEDLVDPAAASRLTSIASDVGRLTDRVPLGDAFAVLRYADNTDDLARVARVANAAGDETRASLAVLGKARALRLTTRLTDMAMLTGALLAALGGQILSFVIWLMRRALRPGGQGRTPRPPSPQRPMRRTTAR